MTDLKIKDVEKKANGTKSTLFENEAYFVTFNLNKDNELNVSVVSKEFQYPSIDVFYWNQVTVNIPTTGSKTIAETKNHISEVKVAVETASQIEVLLKHYIF